MKEITGDFKIERQKGLISATNLILEFKGKTINFKN